LSRVESAQPVPDTPDDISGALAQAGGVCTTPIIRRKETGTMPPIQVAIYARVSSDHQVEAQTVASQVAALRDRVAAEDLAFAIYR
jgi:hypothetical protein